jgi:hypothetical protein
MPKHPPAPQCLHCSRGRWLTQAGWSHTVETPLPPCLPLHRSIWQVEKGWGQAAVYHSTCRLRSLALQRCAILGQSCSSRGERHQPAALSPREEFFRLYELCVAIGFAARVAIRSAAGTQEISLSCCFRATPSSTSAPVAQRRRFQGVRPDKPRSG